MKKNTLRILSLCMAALMAVCLTACGGSKTPETPETPSIEVPKEYARHVSPWELDVVQDAIDNQTMEFYFMSDLGSTQPGKWGDACLIVFPNGETMLLDSGKTDLGKLLVWNLKRMGIEKLDYVMMSHHHDDHCYGLVYGGILDEFEIGQFYHNEVYLSGYTDPQFMEKAVAARGIPSQTLTAGDKLSFGDVQMEVLWPKPEAVGISVSNNDLNDYSLVLRFDYKDTSALFTGDIFVKVEEELVDMYGNKLDTDLLKIPHHGAMSSNSELFANTVTPKVAVATGYQAMAAQLYARYTATGSKVYLDFCDGYIHVTSDGTEMTWETSRERSTNAYDDYEYKG